MNPMRIKQKELGFTLVELLVVIIIIGIIASIALVAFTNQRQTANDATVTSDLKNIATSVQTLLVNDTQSPIVRSTDKKAVRSGTFTEPVNVSPEVSWDVYGSSNGYCILGWHANGKKATQQSPLVYDSLNGGLKKPGQSCSPVPNAPNGTVISTAGSDTVAYAWSGTPHNSTSTAQYADGTVRTNLITNPSLEANLTSFTANNLTLSRDNTWFSNGSYSLKTVPTGSVNSFASVGGDSGGLRLGMQPGKTYTASATIRIENALTGPFHSSTYRNRNMVVVYETSTSTSTRYSTAPSNTAGSSRRVVVTFTLPANATDAYIRLYNGSSNSADAVYFDDLVLEEGTTAGDYFDGSTVN